MSLVSIIIPTFNRSKLLKRALESIYKQSYSEYEIIVIDDGSTDKTAEMISALFADVNYIYQSNSGVSAARNKGLEQAKGEWLAFLDSDDEWLPQKLEKQLDELKSMAEYKICHTEELWMRNGIRVNQMKKHKKAGGWIFPQCLPLCAMSPSSILINQSVFDDIGDFDAQLPACEDYDLWLRITAKYPVLYIEEPQIIKYGGHEDQLSKKYWGMDRFRIQALQKIISANYLTEDYRLLAIAMLQKKCSIFQQGAFKRGKADEAQHYQQIAEQFLSV
ncbi:MAG: glycosyltransferase family 2 protein [Methylococcaceae bacterium]|nr:glycosyltransferase family 2 protein [Methylococcaceae bacterium]